MPSHEKDPPHWYARAASEVQGRYCPVGPVLQVAAADAYRASTGVPLDGPEFHAYLHHAQITSSTMGVVDAAFACMPYGNHRSLAALKQGVDLSQPYMQATAAATASPECRDILDGIVHAHALRALLAGYASGAWGDHDPFYSGQTSIDRAARSFRDMYRVFAPEMSEGFFADLDGRRADSERVPAAPQYPGGSSFGATAVSEAFACAAQAIVPGGRDIRDVVDLDVSERNRRQTVRGGPSTTAAVVERLAPTVLALPRHPGVGHPWAKRVGPDPASHYRDAVLLLARELEPGQVLAAPLIETLVAFCELAMNPALLTGHTDLWAYTPSWSAIHPGYRFCDLCHCARRVGFAPRLDRSAPIQGWNDILWTYLDEVCEYMEWPPHSAVVAANAGMARSRIFQALPPHQHQLFTALNGRKLENLPSVLLGALPPHEGPSTIIEHFSNGESAMRSFDEGFGFRIALRATILDEYYFQHGLDLSKSLVEAVAPAWRRNLADACEEELRIRGLSEALCRTIT